jgi:uncharacterized protein
MIFGMMTQDSESQTTNTPTAGGLLTPGTRFPVRAHIRDILHDRVPLGEPELALLSCPAFLRLERIQQLGFVSRIWPGARHARYEHSLGVFHLARLAVDRLRLEACGSDIDDADARTLCAAALLHDIGHYPFSHAIEELGPPVIPHEEVGRRVICAEPVSSILGVHWDVDPERVAAIVAPGSRQLPAVDKLLRGILSGSLDVDKLDYLPRDAMGCGVPYGGVDTTRLIDSLRIATPPGEPGQRIVIDAKGVSPLHSLINARQEMFDNVYWHHTNRACMVMLLRAVQEALIAGSISGETLTELDDASLLAALAAPEMPVETRRLVAGLQQRHIHKRAVEFSSNATSLYEHLTLLFHDPVQRRSIELGMAERLSDRIGKPVSPEAILIDVPKPEKWRTDVWVQFERPPVGFSTLMPWREVVGLTDDDFKRFEERRRLIRIVCSGEYREVVRASWEPLLLPGLGIAL